MPTRQFKTHFRFSKLNVKRISALLNPYLSRRNNRGCPLSVDSQVCIALEQLGCAAFQRTTGLSGGVSQSCARTNTLRVVNALFSIRRNWIRFPSHNEMRLTAQFNLNKFGLKDFFAGVDGCLMRFQKCPRGIPPRQNSQLYWCRKQFYALNVQIVSNNTYIYSVDCGWFGRAHDSRVWNRSQAKQEIETNTGQYLICGDSAYPISAKLIKPFHNPDQNQARFNAKLNGMRTIMTENVYSHLKQRFPILRELRYNLAFSQRVIEACCVLHNITEFIKNEISDDAGENALLNRVEVGQPGQQIILDNDVITDNQRRNQGQALRTEIFRNWCLSNNIH